MHSTKLSAFCDRILEAGWILAVIVTPLFFNVYSSRVFEPDKLTTLRSIALVMVAAWLVKLVEEYTSGRRNVGFTWRTPLIVPTLAVVGVYLVSTLLSVTPQVSFFGSYQRLQGTFTTYSYIVVFLMIVQGLRTRAQLNRLLTAMILNSLPIALYGLIQRNGLDPLPWGGDVQTRVASNMGNAIFVAAYLIMIFPLTVGKIVESFRSILKDDRTDWADIVRAAGYIFIAALQVITILYSRSRGPLLGLLTGGFYLFLLLGLNWRNRGLVLAVIALAIIGGTFLGLLNIPNGPLESLRQNPVLSRFGTLAQAESGTGKVRSLIWEGTLKLVLPHPAIQFPDGHKDPFNILRPLVGYGPESMYVAYNNFYPPLLGHYESRTASPDRSHNETWDSLAITGILGFLAYLGVFGSVFYYGFRWLGLMQDRKDHFLFFGLAGLFALILLALFWRVEGPHFFGVAVTFGIAIGWVVYLAVQAILAGRRMESVTHPQSLMIIVLMAMAMAHFIEINFGIAIASTRTTFWAGVGMLVVLGMDWVGDTLSPRAAAAAPGAKKNDEPQRKRRRVAASPSVPAASSHEWLWPTLSAALIVAFLIGTLSFCFVTNSERLSNPLQVFWRALTVLPAQDSRTSYGALLIFGITWVIGSGVLVAELVREGAAGGVQPENWWKVLVVCLLVSLVVGVSFGLVLAAMQSALINISVTSLEELVAVGDRVAGLLTQYYWFLFFTLFALATLLLVGQRETDPRSFPKPVTQTWGLLAAPILGIVALVLIVNWNLRPIQADIVYKQADPYDREQRWDLSIPYYEHAIEMAPYEDFYYLWLGRARLEQATQQTDAAQRDLLLRVTEQTLQEAREKNPLNTDHSANLARMYRRWSDLVSDPAEKLEKAQRSAEEYAIATQLSPNNVLLWNEWATLYYYNLGDLGAGEAALGHSVSIDPDFDQTWLICGETSMDVGDLERAAVCYRYALELNPNNTQVWRALASVESQLGHYDEAIEALESLLALNPAAGDAWDLQRVIAIWRYEQGRYPEAAEAAELALAVAPPEQQETLQQLLAQIQMMATQTVTP